jgi:hypothetical protein
MIDHLLHPNPDFKAFSIILELCVPTDLAFVDRDADFNIPTKG